MAVILPGLRSGEEQSPGDGDGQASHSPAFLEWRAKEGSTEPVGALAGGRPLWQHAFWSWGQEARLEQICDCSSGCAHGALLLGKQGLPLLGLWAFCPSWEEASGPPLLGTGHRTSFPCFTLSAPTLQESCSQR